MHEIVVVHMLKIWDVALRQNGILSFQNHSIIKSKFEKKKKTPVFYIINGNLNQFLCVLAHTFPDYCL